MTSGSAGKQDEDLERYTLQCNEQLRQILPGLTEQDYGRMDVTTIWNEFDDRYYIEEVRNRDTGKILWPNRTPSATP